MSGLSTRAATPRLTVSLAVLGVVLTGCGPVGEVLWPSITPEGGVSTAAPSPTPTPPTLASGAAERARQITAEAARLRASVAQRSTALQQARGEMSQAALRHQGQVAAITARLQAGAGPGEAALSGQWDQAKLELDRIDSGIAYLGQLANQNAADAGMVTYLREAARGVGDPAALAEADRRALSAAADEANRSGGQVDRLGIELREEISRQNLFVARERGALAALAEGIKLGTPPPPGAPPPAAAAPTPAPPAAAPPSAPAAIAGRRPLVVIRFDRPDPPYEQPLYTAVSRVLELRPDAVFDLVAIAPERGERAQRAAAAAAARRHSDGVLRSLNEMGLAPERIATSTASSAEAQSPEVRLYIR